MFRMEYEIKVVNPAVNGRQAGHGETRPHDKGEMHGLALCFLSY
jgi:hypothetical protein